MSKKTNVFKVGNREYAIMRPTAKINEDATMEYNRVFSKALQNGALLRESLEKYMREQKLWDDERETKYVDILRKIHDNETVLRKGGIKLSDAKTVALDTRGLRAALQSLIAEKNTLDVNTAQGQAENARFNYLMISCLVYNDTGETVYQSIDEYNSADPSDGVAAAAAENFASMYFGLDDNYEGNLPENRFLKKWKFSDDSGDLIDQEGRKVDFLGRLVDDEGRYINEDGKWVDVDGNLVDEEGNIVVDEQPFLDDEGKPVGGEEGKDMEGKTKKRRGRPKKTETA